MLHKCAICHQLTSCPLWLRKNRTVSEADTVATLTRAPAVWLTSWLTRTRLSCCRSERRRSFCRTSSYAREATLPSHDLPPASRACRSVTVCAPCTRSWQCPASVSGASVPVVPYTMTSLNRRTQRPVCPSLPNDLSTLLYRPNVQHDYCYISIDRTNFLPVYAGAGIRRNLSWSYDFT